MSARSKVHMQPVEGHLLYEVRFTGKHIGAVVVDPLDMTRYNLIVDGKERELKRHEFSTGEARRNGYGEQLLCRNEPQHFIKPDALYTVQDEEPECQKCRPFEVLNPLP